MVSKLYNDQQCRFVDNVLFNLMRAGGANDYTEVINALGILGRHYDNMMPICTIDYSLVEIKGVTHRILELGKQVHSLKGFRNYLDSLDEEERRRLTLKKEKKFYERWEFWIGVLGVIAAFLALMFK